MPTDKEHYEQLSQAFETGTIEIDPDSVVRRAPEALTEEALIDLMVGRPRAEEAVTTKTWHIRTPEDLHQRVKEQARKEGLPDSALIRKAVRQYLVTA